VFKTCAVNPKLSCRGFSQINADFFSKTARLYNNSVKAAAKTGDERAEQIARDK
jgi:hypothetical protein